MTTRAELNEAEGEARTDATLSVEPPETLELAYGRLAGELTRFAAGMVGTTDAPDVVASAVARCVRVDWAALDNADAYLYRAVYNEATGMRRRFARRSGLNHRIPRSPTAVDASEHVVDDQLLVAEALAALSPQQRAVIVLTYWNAMPVSAVADHLELSHGAVKKQLARARAKLREELT